MFDYFIISYYLFKQNTELPRNDYERFIKLEEKKYCREEERYYRRYFI